MIIFLDVLSFLFDALSALLLYQILKIFFPMRGKLPVRLMALLPLYFLSATIIFVNDPVNVLWALVGFLVYMLAFYKSGMIQKLSIVLVLYPMLIAINYLTQDIGMQLFFAQPNQSSLMSTVIHTVSMAFRPALWVLIWRICRRWAQGSMAMLNTKMWLLLDSVCLAGLVSLVMVLNYTPKNILVSYPVAFACMVTVFGSLYLAEYIASSVQTRYQLDALEARHEYYEDKLKEEQRVRSIYHDMKNHLLLLRQGDEQVAEMAQSLGAQIASYENYYKTGNDFLDVIIRDKAEKARSAQIDFSVMLRFEDGGFMQPLDISTIFGNALDNAIEASLKLPVSQRLITAKASRVHDMLSIVIENNMADVPSTNQKTGKRDKFLHGYGIDNIKSAAEKYEGECSTKQEGGRFALSIIIPIPQ